MKKISLDKGAVYLHELEEIHPGGNKYYKLKYNLALAKTKGLNTLISFGGAWSNHLYALAKVGKDQGFSTIGIVRGERPITLSAMLSDAETLGMRLVFVSRSEFRQKETPAFRQWLVGQFGDFYLIPEGGTNPLAVKGCEEIVDSLSEESFDLLCLPVGTGGTIAGIARGLLPTESAPAMVMGFSVLKGAINLDDVVSTLINNPTNNNWSINHQYHCGGYAKCPDFLKTFILEVEAQNDVKLDPVYTAKMIFGIDQLLKEGLIDSKQKIIALHTGGLQGRRGFNF
jgi:1-aminocyclopropane-1-carboxylate deaminase